MASLLSNVNQPLHSTGLHIQLNEIAKIEFHGKFVPPSIIVILNVSF
jgi:hypothetical protein